MIEISETASIRARAHLRDGATGPRIGSVIALALALLSLAGCAEAHGLADGDADVDRPDSGVPLTRDPWGIGGVTPCGPSDRAPLCASPWDASSLFCCEVSGPAACVEGEWSCASAPALRPGSSVLARECARATWACEGVAPDLDEPRGARALFFLSGRADLRHVRIFAPGTRGSPWACGNVTPEMGPHIAIALDSRPIPGVETAYAWSEGRTPTVTVQRCAGLGVGCVASSQGHLTLKWLDAASRLAASFTASYPDGTIESFELVAEACTGDAPTP